MPVEDCKALRVTTKQRDKAKTQTASQTARLQEAERWLEKLMAMPEWVGNEQLHPSVLRCR